MKKFLTQSIYFFIGILIFNSALYYSVGKLYLKDYREYSLNLNSYLLSDSHGLPLNDFTENYGVFNFSAGSDSYFDMKRKLNFLIKNAKIDTIYITVDDHTLSPYRENINNLDRSSFYKIQSDDEYLITYSIQKYIVDYAVLFNPKIGQVIKESFKSQIKNIVYPKGNRKKINTKPNWNKVSETKRVEQSQRRFNTQFYSKSKSIELEKTLLDIINICKNNNICLIGIKFPLSNDYIKVLNNKSFGADKLFAEKGLIVLDYKKMFISNAEYFANQDHLNKKGGDEFTKVLFIKKYECTTKAHK